MVKATETSGVLVKKNESSDEGCQKEKRHFYMESIVGKCEISNNHISFMG